MKVFIILNYLLIVVIIAEIALASKKNIEYSHVDKRGRKCLSVNFLCLDT